MRPPAARPARAGTGEAESSPPHPGPYAGMRDRPAAASREYPSASDPCHPNRCASQRAGASRAPPRNPMAGSSRPRVMTGANNGHALNTMEPAYVNRGGGE